MSCFDNLCMLNVPNIMPLKWGCRGVCSIWSVQGVYTVSREWYGEKGRHPTWINTYQLMLHMLPFYCVVYIWGRVAHVWGG